MKKSMLWLLGFLAAVGLSVAQEKQPEGMTPPKPKFGPELARLSFLIGNFSTENIEYPSPAGKGGPGKGRNMNRWGLDSLYVMLNYEGNMATMGDYKGHGMITYDGKFKQYKCWWFDNYGNANSYGGGFTGDTLRMETEMPSPQGGMMEEKIMWYPEGKKFKFRMTWDIGQGPMPVMEETATPSAEGARMRPKK